MANRSRSMFSEFKLGLILAGSLLVSTSAWASELNVADKVGTTFLRVDASEGTKFDLVIYFKNTNVNLPANSDLTLVSDKGDVTSIPLDRNVIKDGVQIQNVALGDYTVTANPDLLEVKSISVTENNAVAANEKENEDGGVSTATYAIGAAALAGGVIAVSAGGDGMDVFSGSSSSGSSSARSGSGTSGGSIATSGAVTGGGAPEISALSTSEFDPNYPSNIPQLVGTPSAFPTPRGAPPTQNSGSGLQTNPGGSTPTPTPAIPNPTLAPPPAVTNPMTPS